MAGSRSTAYLDAFRSALLFGRVSRRLHHVLLLLCLARLLRVFFFKPSSSLNEEGKTFIPLLRIRIGLLPVSVAIVSRRCNQQTQFPTSSCLGHISSGRKKTMPCPTRWRIFTYRRTESLVIRITTPGCWPKYLSEYYVQWGGFTPSAGFDFRPVARRGKRFKLCQNTWLAVTGWHFCHFFTAWKLQWSFAFGPSFAIPLSI